MAERMPIDYKPLFLDAGQHFSVLHDSDCRIDIICIDPDEQGDAIESFPCGAF